MFAVLIGAFALLAVTAAHATAPPTVTGLSLTSGPAAGGTSVTITGTSLGDATGVTFGTTPAASFTVQSDTSIVATSPAHAAGTVDVFVTTPFGTSPAAEAATKFTYRVPVVTGVTPATGSTAGGISVTIAGTGLSGATLVTFGDTAATIVSNSDTAIVVTNPAHTAGTVDVLVTTPYGTNTASVADQFTYANLAAIAVTSVSPSTGPASGGTGVVVAGYGFMGATAVTFGGSPAASFSVINDTTIVAVSPAHAAGAVDIVVTSPSGTSATGAADVFTYTAASVVVTAISPVSGPVAGGTSVTITGSGFTGATAVTFGGMAATSFTVQSDTTILALSPAHAVGMVDVQVTAPGGTSAVTAADQFTYTGVISVTSVTPSSGPVAGGTVVSVVGSGFTGATSVTFGGVGATFTIVSDTQITATAPAASGPGVVNVQVSNATNSSAVSSANRYTYIAPGPTVTGLSPSSGPSGGGTIVTINGTGFSFATSVVFGGIGTGFNILSDTQITVVSPPHAPGTIDVVVSNSGGPSTNTSADNFLYVAGLPICPAIPLWVNDLAYGSIGGGFYYDPVSGLVWTGQRGWHIFSPQPPRPSPQPLWVNAYTYGSIGQGFWWDPVSGLAWTGERGWHQYSPQGCTTG
ncbi:MAG: IPT/TIG domain-containing protein [Chloroflexi bacterium]|nr:IPT/TIG domain-containing protein [Chloroflexota bacterium]